MKLKKYTADTEDLAMELVNDDLGEDVLIINVKKIQTRGIKSLFKRQLVEVTAAYDENFEAIKKSLPTNDEIKVMENNTNEGLEFLAQMNIKSKLTAKTEEKPIRAFNILKENNNIEKPSEEHTNFEEDARNYFEVKDVVSEDLYFDRETIFDKKNKKEKIVELENYKESKMAESNFINKKIIEQEEEISKLQTKLIITEERLEQYEKEILLFQRQPRNKKYRNKYVEMIYETLLQQGVENHIAEKLLEDVEKMRDAEKIDINFIVKIVYNKIIKILGEPKTIDISSSSKGNPKVITIIGPTGVGKTTTIAKLSSNFILNDNIDVGLITSDTYRIAAIEQLKTYAEILNIDVKVVYDNLELVDNLVFMGRLNDVIMIDTAGRSHKNFMMMNDLKDLLDYLYESEKYLVLSLPTNSDDLIEIVQSYQKFTDFSIIFTKLDETSSMGTILNVCYTTGKKLSYLTVGQSVPDDIEIMNPVVVAKSILGLGGEG